MLVLRHIACGLTVCTIGIIIANKVAAEDNGVPLLSNQHFIQRSDGSDLLSNVIDIEEASDEFKKTIETEKDQNYIRNIIGDLVAVISHAEDGESLNINEKWANFCFHIESVKSSLLKYNTPQELDILYDIIDLYLRFEENDTLSEENLLHLRKQHGIFFQIFKQIYRMMEGGNGNLLAKPFFADVRDNMASLDEVDNILNYKELISNRSRDNTAIEKYDKYTSWNMERIIDMALYNWIKVVKRIEWILGSLGNFIWSSEINFRLFANKERIASIWDKRNENISRMWEELTRDAFTTYIETICKPVHELVLALKSKVSVFQQELTRPKADSMVKWRDILTDVQRKGLKPIAATAVNLLISTDLHIPPHLSKPLYNMRKEILEPLINKVVIRTVETKARMALIGIIAGALSIPVMNEKDDRGQLKPGNQIARETRQMWSNYVELISSNYWILTGYRGTTAIVQAQLYSVLIQSPKIATQFQQVRTHIMNHLLINKSIFTLEQNLKRDLTQCTYMAKIAFKLKLHEVRTAIYEAILETKSAFAISLDFQIGIDEIEQKMKYFHVTDWVNEITHQRKHQFNMLTQIYSHHNFGRNIELEENQIS